MEWNEAKIFPHQYSQKNFLQCIKQAIPS